MCTQYTTTTMYITPPSTIGCETKMPIRGSKTISRVLLIAFIQSCLIIQIFTISLPIFTLCLPISSIHNYSHKAPIKHTQPAIAVQAIDMPTLYLFLEPKSGLQKIFQTLNRWANQVAFSLQGPTEVGYQRTVARNLVRFCLLYTSRCV